MDNSEIMEFEHRAKNCLDTAYFNKRRNDSPSRISEAVIGVGYGLLAILGTLQRHHDEVLEHHRLMRKK